jgi:Sulfotransferase family
MGPPNDHKLVFIGGLHRSGTTLLARCLAEHPMVSGFEKTGVPADEGQHLQTVYPTAKVFGGPGRFAFSDGAHMTETSPLAVPENAARLFTDWSPHWNLGCPVLVEKSPPNLIRSRFLQALYPDASFVMIVRHPIPVSLATQKWSRTSLRSLIRHWVTAHQTFEVDRPHLARIHVLSYEHLVTRVQECLDSVYAFLELEPHATSLVTRDGNEPYFVRWRGLSRVRRRLLVRRYEREVSRFGYSLRDADRSG